MRKALRRAGKNILWFILLGLGVLLFVAPLVRGLWLRQELVAVLDNAASVQVVEHSSQFDEGLFDPAYREVTYTTVVLTQTQIDSLRRALSPSLDYTGEIEDECIFDEHHRVVIQRKDGTRLTVHLCFHCGDLCLDSEDVRMMPVGWHPALSAFMSGIGMHPDGPWPKAK